MISAKETECSCGCGFNINPSLLARLNEFRDDFGHPMIVSSGARCLAVNTKCGGKPRSAHLAGRAVDFVRTPELVKFLSIDVLTKHGLYLEHLDATPTWCHITDRAPPSGHRVFWP